ncbi:SRPBCC family protein [Amycolatopsis australiensis]|uniref:Polyketide cyclase / dehydrase and lipid transport n=1 Tax=Amycolatopsis australiensis TaxID=546364 RepID=A0A1K1PQ08_9PSEU|nr:SRPBCC family protein [Amycolatopsis australiensis]SFW49768.1 Polyketide cyclase / dehydrase and lipid transport [Amycolatopsis australiensis]
MPGRKFSFEVNRTSTASPDTLFALEADGPSWAKWGKPLVVQARWARQGTGEPAGVGAVREVGLWPVLVREETVEYEPGRRHVYTFFRGRPLKDYRAEVVFTPADGGGTHLRWTGSFTEPVQGSGPLLAAGLKRVIELFSGKLVKAAETRR